jgi:hypothetical protein
MGLAARISKRYVAVELTVLPNAIHCASFHYAANSEENR